MWSDVFKIVKTVHFYSLQWYNCAIRTDGSHVKQQLPKEVPPYLLLEREHFDIYLFIFFLIVWIYITYIICNLNPVLGINGIRGMKA